MTTARSPSSDAARIGQRAALLRRVLSDLAIMSVIGVFLALIGPFGSIEQPLALRLITWLAFAYAGYAIYSPMGALVERAHRSLDLPKAPLWIAATLIATVPMSALVHTVQYLPAAPPMPGLETALTHYFYVFVIGGAVTLLFNVLRRQTAHGDGEREDAGGAQAAPGPRPDSAPVPPAPAPPQNPLFDALPADLGSDVIALEMEDHYVRVHTALGSELVLMRLRDAMACVGEIEGRQVHRSWWVARLAVEDVRREGRNVRLILPRGIEAPVARAQVAELRDAGWL